MATIDDSNKIFGPLDEQDLLDRGLLGPVLPDGRRRLHLRLVNGSSDETFRSIPLDVPLDSPEADDAFTTIPTHIISRATLIHVGFTAAKAAEIWERWTNWPDDSPPREIDPPSWAAPMTFIDFMSGAIGELRDTWDTDNQKWIDCMNFYGMNREFQDAILDPVYDDHRLRETCATWIKDTIEIRYENLYEVQKTSLARETVLIEKRLNA
ncbi:hypothetical protein V2A60_008885 [Cordyceps javanica]|uniref:Uncharacterized protein n=1 Tax=Cordyceps javanica TaxID=43265 RepID=A0A545VN72_9HYPO|nr:hypothetical protein IF1G_09968 [Cordyceps javanica]TQW03116.1 hypothetical protein IF2G_09249 [Cordyceps javanica]